jgi:NAD(P)-dependent dehydrogenase (short-subunit alcohol dehydrogenase family)
MGLLDGKTVIVSGIGPGLGQQLAVLAAAEGARLAICARTPAKLDAAEAAIRERGLDTAVLQCAADVRDRAQCRALVDRTIERFGAIDVLFNSAYVTGGYALAHEADLDDWRATLETNFFGAMNLIQLVLPAMIAAGGGSIVNVNTKVTRLPYPTMGGYAVSKAALRMATAQLAKEVSGLGIRVNSVFPGWMWGPTVEAGLARQAEAEGRSLADLRAEIASNIPIGDIPEDRACAKAIVALASDYFAVVTGACLDLSGGEYLPL